MDNGFRIVRMEREQGHEPGHADRFGLKTAQAVRAFHKTFSEYTETPLVELRELAGALGVTSIHVKDESFRFGLNAFKVLGGSYCIGKYIAERVGVDPRELSCEKLLSPEIHAKLKDLTFITATDGNHGRGIAWTAGRLGLNSTVYLPKGTAPERLHNIQALGSDAMITDLNYDDTVRFARETAEAQGWVLVQDTSWDTYETIPRWIMEGYTTMAVEAAEQLGDEIPTHIFLQAGVGSMAGSVAGFFAALYGPEKRPVITVVEPNSADCMYQTAKHNDGTLYPTAGNLDTIMAGLACGEPCSLAWDVLAECAECFVAMPDYVAAKGMRVLGNPMGKDPRIISGESGASTVGLVAEVLQNRELDDLRTALKLDHSSRILCFSTEGDTDRVNYRRIVWDGLFGE